MSSGIKLGLVGVGSYFVGKMVKESGWYADQVKANAASGGTGAPLTADLAVYGAAFATAWVGHRFLLHKKEG